MEDDQRHLEELAKASLIAERALDAAFDDSLSAYPEAHRKIWASAAILHCDILRYMVTLENSTTQGILRLLWIGDIVSLLYEAKLWFDQSGGSALLQIAQENGYMTAQSELRAIRIAHPLQGIDSFANYRNKVGHHYDQDFVQHLHDFSLENANPFFELLLNYAMYSTKWTVLCKKVIEHAYRPKV